MICQKARPSMIWDAILTKRKKERMLRVKIDSKRESEKTELCSCRDLHWDGDKMR